MSSSSSSTPHVKWMVRASIGLAAIVLLYLGVAFALSRFLDPEELAAWVEPRLEKALSRDVDVARVDVSFFPLGVGLRNVTLSDPTGLAPYLARVESVELRVGVLPLLRRVVQVNRVTLDGFDADLRVAAGGESNFGDLSTRNAGNAADPQGNTPSRQESVGGEEEERAESPFTIDLRSLRFNDGGVRFTREIDTVVVEVGTVDLRASLRRDLDGSWSIGGSGDAGVMVVRGGSETLWEDTPLELSFDVQTDGGLDLLRLHAMEVRMDDLTLNLTGEVDGLQEPVRSVSLAISGQALSIPNILDFLPASTRDESPVGADGLLALNLRVDGDLGPGRRPNVSGAATVTQASVTLDGRAFAEDLSAELTLTDASTLQAQLDASSLGGPLSVEGTLTLAGERAVDLTLLANPDLEKLGSFVELQDGVAASGKVDVRVRVTGQLMNTKGLRFDGELKPVSVRVSIPSLAVPIEIPEGRLLLSGIRGIIQDLPVSLGDDRLSISGEMGDVLALLDQTAIPRFDGSVRSSRLDLRRISAKPPPDSALTYGRVAFAKMGGRAVGALGIEEAAKELGLARPDGLPITGSLALQLDTVIGRRGRMEDFGALVDFGPSFIRVSEAVFHQYGGEIRTTANLALGPEETAPFSLNLEARDVDAGRFLSQTSPMGNLVTGRVSLKLDLVGSLDALFLPHRPALVGSGSFALSGGLTDIPLTQALARFLGLESLRTPSIQDWGTSFILENGSVRLAEATVHGAPGTPRVGGTVGLDGGLNLRSAFDLPSQRLDGSTLARLGIAGDVAARVLERPEVVQAILRIGGSVFDPTVQADPQAAALTLGSAIEEEVRSEAQERVDAQRAEAERVLQEQEAEAQRRIEEQKQQLQNRATGFLRGLAGRRDTVQVPPPPDTSGFGQIPGDTVRPDTLIPDTILRDTLRPDTLRPDTVRPDTVRPDTLRPDTLRPDTVRPDTTLTDTIYHPSGYHPA